MDKKPQESNKLPAAEQRAENVAYTINHALACTATDLASPYVSHTILSKVLHQHSTFTGWLISEGVGDFLAVPVTVAIEDHAPRLANGVRKAMEPAVGWVFRASARREARAWAVNNEASPESERTHKKEEQIYQYEMEHLPQAAIWTATSFAFNIATQKLFHKYMHEDHCHHHDDHQTLLGVTAALMGGKAFSTGLVVGARAAFPDKAHSWDNYAARKVFAPATNAVSKLFGVDTGKNAGWEERVKRDDTLADTVPAR